MTTAELVNKIVEKLHPQSRVCFVRFEGKHPFDIARVVFDFAGNRYIAESNCSRIVVRQLEHNSELYQLDNHYSRWVEGVLNGKMRNEAGVLS